MPADGQGLDERCGNVSISAIRMARESLTGDVQRYIVGTIVQSVLRNNQML